MHITIQLYNKKGVVILNFKIEELPRYRLAYMRQVGPYGENNRILMETFKVWAKSNGLYTPTGIILGIAQDGPGTLPENCRYDVGVVVDDGFVFAGEVVKEAYLPGGGYAIFQLQHTAEAVQRAWQEIFPFLVEQGLQFDITRPILERYIPQMVDNHLCEICVPV